MLSEQIYLTTFSALVASRFQGQRPTEEGAAQCARDAAVLARAGSVELAKFAGSREPPPVDKPS